MPGFLHTIRMADVADILIVSACVYLVLRWVQTTASRGIAIGAVVVVSVYLASLRFNLYLTSMLFQFGMTIAAVVIVVVFQEDIRRAVERLMLASRWRGTGDSAATQPHVETLLDTAFDLAAARRGALIVIAGDEPLESHLTCGTELVGRISRPLLDSLFDPHSAGHDGAVIVENGFVTRFGVHLPLSTNREKSKGLGTRHRSGLGLAERTDALVVIVSEERGQVSIASQSELRRKLPRDEVRDSLISHIRQTAEESRPGFAARMLKHPRTKLLAVLIAVAAWLSVASGRDQVQRVFAVPIEYRNVPAGRELPASVLTEARVTFSGTERAFQFVAPSALRISIDVSEAANGKEVFTLTESSVKHPTTLTVYRIEPRSIRLLE